MTLTMGLRYKNPDASTDINLRLKDVANKGFVAGGDLEPVAGSLEIDVTPFVCINFDGAVVRSDATIRLPVAPGVVNYVFLRARYVPLGSPILQVQCVDAASFAALQSVEGDWLHVVGTINNPIAPAVVAANISYTARHIVDSQGRGFYRGVANDSGSLPRGVPNQNRNGDVRLTLDTRSFFTWNSSIPPNGDWQQVNDASLNSHRDEEHHNGIVASSSASTLSPTATSTNINIANVPAGSAVTIDGMRVAGPAGPTLIAAGAGGRTSEGLIQVWMNSLGVVSAEYRLSYAATPANINNVFITDISDNHAPGTFVLSFDSGDTSLQWNNGEPVLVSTGNKYKLYDPSYSQWVEVNVVSLPSSNVTDSVQVFASRKTDTTFLIAYYRWNGSTTLSMEEDKRIFGNLDYPEMSDDFKNLEYAPRWAELRGSGMIWGGGDCTRMEFPNSLMLRMTGPLVAYVNGRRFVVPVVSNTANGFVSNGQFGYSGITIPDNQTRYLYVNSSGSLICSAIDPTVTAPAGTYFAEIAKVVTASGLIVEPVEDRRDPTLIVGQATRDSRLVFSKTGTARWNESENSLYVEQNGSATGTSVTAGVFYAQDGVYRGLGPIELNDDNSGTSVYVTDTAHEYLGPYQIGVPSPRDTSIVGAIADGQEAQRAGVGCIDPCTVSSDGANEVTISTGTFFDFQGRKVVIGAPIAFNTTFLPNGSYDVFWNGSGAVFEIGSKGARVWRNELVFAVFQKASGVVATTAVTECQLYATGNNCQEEFSIGADVASLASGGNFSTLRKALVFRCCYGSSYSAPRRFAVYDQITEANKLVDFNDFEFALANDRLDGLHIYGSPVTATSVNRAILRWGESGVISTAPFINFRNQVNSVKFTDLRIEYRGNSGSNNDNCWIKDPGANLVVENCGFSPDNNAPVGSPLYCMVNYSTGSLGGVAASPVLPGVLFKNCNFYNVCTGDEMFALTTASISGRLAFENCSFAGSGASAYNRVVNVSSGTATCDVSFDNCSINGFTSTIIEAQLGATGKLQVMNSTLSGGAGARLAPTSGRVVDIVNCELASTLSIADSRFSQLRNSSGTILNYGSGTTDIVSVSSNFATNLSATNSVNLRVSGGGNISLDTSSSGGATLDVFTLASGTSVVNLNNSAADQVNVTGTLSVSNGVGRQNVSAGNLAVGTDVNSTSMDLGRLGNPLAIKGLFGINNQPFAVSTVEPTIPIDSNIIYVTFPSGLSKIHLGNGTVDGQMLILILEFSSVVGIVTVLDRNDVNLKLGSTSWSAYPEDSLIISISPSSTALCLIGFVWLGSSWIELWRRPAATI